ncbi:HIT domain-containing protein [Candidatus Nitrosopelagicus sp.]|nr:HIT domain-containing protein [Candidatus Nitrosopelagicus sp.]
MDCIFCKIVSKEIPAKILYEDDDTISFLDAFPITKGHTLVIPKKHFPQIQDMPDNVNQKLFDTVHKIIPKTDSVKGSTLVLIHNGKESGQEIMHVHVHLIPRGLDDSGDHADKLFQNKFEMSDDDTSKLLDDLKIT